MPGADRSPGDATEQEALRLALPAYEIGPSLGRGSFAVVYAGRHMRLGRDVAIKRLSPTLLSDLGSRARFAAEARLLASLDHPHVVRVHDYVEDHDVCALVMERLHGGSLAERMRGGRPSQLRSCALAAAALHGLGHAHRHGILHRDVKPENLLFGDGEVLKVADFGIAKVVGAQGAQLTATAALLGTPAYMAPEQVSSSVGPLSPATDVWAIGAVLFELLAGEPPFPRDRDISEILLQRIRDDPERLETLAPEVPPPLSSVVMRALARDPRDRYPTAEACADALEDAVGRHALATAGVPLHRIERVDATDAGGTATAPAGRQLLAPAPGATGRAASAPSRRRTRFAVAGAAIAAAGVAGVLVLVLPEDDERAASRGGAAAARVGALSALPPPPRGWPRTMALGYADPLRGPAGAAERLGPGGLTYEAYGGDAAAGQDWSNASAQVAPGDFVTEAQRAGLMPYAIYYHLRALGRFGKDDAQYGRQLRRTLVNHDLMRVYWGNVRSFLRSLGSAGRPVAISVEPSVWALLEQDVGATPAGARDVRALAGGSGLQELAGLADDLPGVAQGWLRLRDRYAPHALLGFGVTDYGTNVDISKGVPSRAKLSAAARDAGRFYRSLGPFDFAALEIAYSEEGQNPNPQEVYSPAEKQAVVAFVREFVRTAGIPMVLEGVPLGNSVSRAIDDTPYHWRDSWVQWLIGTDTFAGLRALRDAGAIGIQFGVAHDEAETCPCDAAQDGVTNGAARGTVSTSADDDGGYLAERMAALRQAGGMSLAVR